MPRWYRDDDSDRERDRGRKRDYVRDEGRRDWGPVRRTSGEYGRDPRGSRLRDRDNDGDRRRRGRRRSRSRSIDRENFVRRRLDISTSRERSREREKRRRKQQAECIRRAGGFRKLADSEGKEPVRLFWDGFQWVAKTGASSALLADPLLVNSTRKLRRIYFGNLPLHLGLTETNFQHIIFQEMRKRGLCNNPDENPVLCVWFAKDKGNYGFVEFASVEETERALTLDGMDCLGVPVKVSRPNDYCTAPGQIHNPAIHLMGAQSAQMLQMQAAHGMVSLPCSGSTTAAPAVNTTISETTELANSKCIRFKGIIKPSDFENPNDVSEYNEALQDIVDGCADCGRIITAVIINPSNVGHLAYDVGDVFIEFETRQAADSCVSLISGRKYFDRPVIAGKVLDKVFQSTIKPLKSLTNTAGAAGSTTGSPPNNNVNTNDAGGTTSAAVAVGELADPGNGLSSDNVESNISQDNSNNNSSQENTTTTTTSTTAETAAKEILVKSQ